MQVTEVDISLIIVEPERQRQDLGDIEELRNSIRARAAKRGGRFQDGLLQPIVLSGLTLMAGERRLRAHEAEGVSTIYTVDWGDLDQDERDVIEFEENERRKGLHWVERAKFIQRLHKRKLATVPGWTKESTSRLLGYAPSVSGDVSVLQSLALEGLINDQLAKAPSLESAYNSIQRVQNRRLADIANDILAPAVQQPSATGGAGAGAGSSSGSTGAIHSSDGSGAAKAPRADSATAPVPVPVEAIHHASFLEWAPAFRGPKFNFAHVDFPYGIDIDQSDQMGHEINKLYADDPDLYWKLCNCFIDNLDNFLFPSAHVMFWLSMEFYIETYQFFKAAESKTGLVFQKKPLVWHKSDGSGMVPDHRRRPRNTYEVALIGLRGDRHIIKPVASSYGCPLASKRLHPSEKPQPMLEHFFQMFVDDHTHILDPTAGSGAALRAADKMGAARLVGLEIDEQFCKAANGALRQDRAKRNAARALG